MNSAQCLFYSSARGREPREKLAPCIAFMHHCQQSDGETKSFQKEKIQMSILGNSHPSHSIRDTQGTLSLWDLTWRFTPHPTSLFYCLWWHYALRFSSSKWGFYLKLSLLQEISLKNTFLGKNVADYLLTSKTCRCSEQKVQILLVWPRKRHPLKFRNTGHQIVEGKE